MELFKELDNLYMDLVKDVELLNNSVYQTARTSIQQNHGMDILKDNITNMRHLKVSLLKIDNSGYIPHVV